MSTVSYKCPHCGGGMNFIPGTGFKCEYCLSVMTQEELDAALSAEEADLESEAKPEEAPVSVDGSDALVYSCPSCGAEVITDEKTAATVCHYCHNPIVLSAKLKGTFKPDKVIAFNVTKEKAAELFKQHCTGKFFLPRNFYSEDSIENLYGVYYPYWVVDSSVRGRLTARGEIAKTRRVGDDRQVVTTIHDILREGDLELNNMTALATKSEDSELLGYILPFKLDEMRDFSMTYLSGFRAEKRTVERKDMQGEIDRRKQAYARDLLAAQVSGYTAVTNEKTVISTQNEKWSYALLPVWILVYKYGDKTYMYGINGQTGKSYGGLPVDKTKLTLASILAGIVIGVIVLLILGALL